MDMRVGVFVGTQHEPDTDIRDAYEGHVEQTALMAELGYHSVWLGQHYMTYPNQFIQTTPLLARLCAESGDMEVGTNLLLLPLFNPVDVAEQYAAVDIISGGRLILGVGLGYRDKEYETFGVDRKSRTRRFEEALHVLKRLWEEDNVTHEGEFYQVDDVSIRPRPLQRPRPPIWIGATADPAIRRAALLADAWIATSMTHWPEVKQQVDLYHQVRQDAGLPRAERVSKCVEVYLHEDRDEAMRQAELHIGKKYAAYYSWGMGNNVPGESGANLAFGDLVKERFIVGTPDDAIVGVHYHRDQLDTTDLLIRINFPGMDRAAIRRQLELFGRHVLPAINDR